MMTKSDEVVMKYPIYLSYGCIEVNKITIPLLINYYNKP